jgi:hypothetical protein
MPLLRPRVVRSDRPGPGRVPIAAGTEDSLLAAIVKWIPVEVVTVYKAGMGAIPEGWPTVRLSVSAGTILVTALWIAFATTPVSGRISWRQVILAPIAFAGWAVATQTDVMKYLWGAWDTQACYTEHRLITTNRTPSCLATG